MKKYLNKNHKANCVDLMRKMTPEIVQLILTDPPYNASQGGVNNPKNKTGGAYYKVNEEWDKFDRGNSYYEFTENWIRAADSLLVNNGSFIICGSLHNLGELIIIMKNLNYRLINIITWKKANPMPNITRRTLTHSTEFITWFVKGSGWTFNYDEMKKYNDGKQLRDVWEFPLCQGVERIKRKNGRAAHPTQKPLKLFKRLIEMASKKDDIVLDPFVGSGTTSVAAKLLHRQWIGIDSNSEYIRIANKRLKAIPPPQPI